MYSILDIDLDYFNLADDPVRRLEELLTWAARPVSVIVDKHNHAFAGWKRRVRAGSIPVPSHILHVDEHHDMMNERTQSSLANFMYHAMQAWTKCRVHWLVEHPIDSPDIWLNDATWVRLRGRFSFGPRRPKGWPQPDLVSVCTSPEFVVPELRKDLLRVVQRFACPGTASAGVRNGGALRVSATAQSLRDDANGEGTVRQRRRR